MTFLERAVRQLEQALEEQARLSDVYERAIGTAAEFSSYTRLRAATRRVSDRDQAVRAGVYGESRAETP